MVAAAFTMLFFPAFCRFPVAAKRERK